MKSKSSTWLRNRLIAIVFAIGSPAAFATAYSFTTVSRPGAHSVGFLGVNNLGRIVGFSGNSDLGAQTGFIYNITTGVFEDLPGPLGATRSTAYGISDTGTVVGLYAAPWTGSDSRSFIYEGGSYLDFTLPGKAKTTILGISPDARYISGTYQMDDTGLFGYVFDRNTGEMIDLGFNTVARGINGLGIVAGSLPWGSARGPLLYNLNDRVGTNYSPEYDRYFDINDAGIVVGGGYRDGEPGRVMIAGHPGNMSGFNPYGWFDAIGTGVNNSGLVVGMYGTDPENLTASSAFFATTVPEPATSWLVLAGILGCAASQRARSGIRAKRPHRSKGGQVSGQAVRSLDSCPNGGI